VTYFVNRLTLISLAGNPGGQLLTGHAAIGDGRLSGTPTVALTSHTRLLVYLLEPDGRKEMARVPWGSDGR
jgi:hypothetical protein